MKKIDFARALRDPEYRNSLSPVERAMLPSHPSGISALGDNALRSVTGGCGYTACNNCPPPWTSRAAGCGTSFIDSCVGPGEHCP